MSVVLDAKSPPGLTRPAALAMDGASHLLVADAASGALYRIKLADGSAEKVADGLGAVAGLAWDHHGRLFVSDGEGGRVFVIPRPGDKPVVVAKGLQDAADLCLDPTGKRLLVPDRKAGTLTAVAAAVPGAEVDETPLAVRPAVAFPDLQWTGWKGETDDGKPNPLRPIVLTHAGDGSNRVFVATEQGVVHVFPNDQKATKTKVFLDIQDRVSYNDETNEEGFLGLAFHPKYKENGEFFVFYTTKKAKRDQRAVALPGQQGRPRPGRPRLRGGTAAHHASRTGTTTAACCASARTASSTSRTATAAPATTRTTTARTSTRCSARCCASTWTTRTTARTTRSPRTIRSRTGPAPGRRSGPTACATSGGCRSTAKTGRLWAADVGQNLFEEIDLIRKGGNYGWNRREGLHPFGARGTGPRPDFIEPIWEYDHDVGKCIIGGYVYRGTRLPELEGYYLYGDYVTTKIWALRYDEAKGRVDGEPAHPGPRQGDVLFRRGRKGGDLPADRSLDGKGIYGFFK